MFVALVVSSSCNNNKLSNVFSDKKRCIPLTEKTYFLYSYYRDQGTWRLIRRNIDSFTFYGKYPKNKAFIRKT